MTEAERRRMIQERQRTSVFWKFIHTLGSLKLALVLLSTIAIACAVATFAESKFSSRVAQDYIYKAPWFLLWLGVLCVNLIAATLTRWPWQKKHTGFIVTHAGIIILLIGAVVGMKAGFEASVTLNQGAPPATRLVINETILQVDNMQDGAVYILPLPVQTRVPTVEKPRKLPLPQSRDQLLVEAYEEALVERPVLVPSEATESAPGLSLKFASGMMSQQLSRDLWLGDESTAKQDFFGLASIAMVPEMKPLPPVELMDVDETHVIFAAQPQQPIVHSFTDNPSSVRIVLENVEGTFQLRIGNKPPRPIDELRGNPVTSEELNIELVDFWPDFVMKDGKPETASNEPNHPAALVRVRGKAAPAASDAKLRLELNVRGHELAWRVLRGEREITSGSVREGESFAPGWADWQVTPTRILPRSTQKLEIAPVKPDAPEAEGAVPGIRVRKRSHDGTVGEPVWIRSGRSEEVRSRPVSMPDDHAVRVGFGLRTHRLPFSVELVKFEVPRDEGTNTPANFISTVRFTDLMSGQSKELVSKMNHPASYPGGWWRTMTGLTYKFSQASWNPQNLKETTLQVLYDPGWLFKWIGSLMISIGIALLFYFKPVRKS